MKVREAFPHEVRAIENVWIEMSDGIKLAARLWLPADAESRPVPGVLEYIPYRKRDLKRDRDSTVHPYIAGHGYACLRVDLRGSGDSEGVLADEYLEQELVDGEEILAWMARQPWCTGTIAMIGISWGGFNGLQVAARQPPELGAVITLCSTDDRYADDVHYMGGCLLTENLSWATVMFGRNCCPPDPAVVGDRWRAMWRERLAGSGLWVSKWMRHQRRDSYWKHGSVSEDYDAIQVPVLAASGWADGYSNSVFRLLKNLKGPRLGLIGPWGHHYPHMGRPGPAIGFLQETVRFLDRWLKGADNGIDQEPMLRAYMQEPAAPQARYDVRPGRWVGEATWPSERVEERRFRLALARLTSDAEDVAEERLTIQSPLTVGLFAGKWFSYATAPDMPHDQREEDGGALVFETEPLDAPLEILGPPVVELELESNKPVAMVAVRLSVVAPNDQATRVTYGLLNLTHRDGHEEPARLSPGKRYPVRVQLNDVAQRFPAGHSIRLAVSTSYWPLAWPPPEPARLCVWTGVSTLSLPVRPIDEGEPAPEFEPAEGAAPIARTVLEPSQNRWRVIWDLNSDEAVLEVIKDEGRYRIEEIDMEVSHRTVESYSFRYGDFDSVRGETRCERSFAREDWSVRTITCTTVTSTKTDFRVRAELDAYEGESRVFSESWDEVIPRDHV